MKAWKETLLPKSATLRDVIKVFNDAAIQIALIVDKDRILLGTVTDGDIRRGILKGVTLEDPAEKVMNTSPLTATRKIGAKQLVEMMNKNQFRHIPIIDDTRRVVGIQVLEDLLQTREKQNWVVLMAGGMGSRMSPLTDDRPKPMLPVGNKPLLETILGNFTQYGFRKFFFAVNYRAEMIEEYFGDGSKWGIEIKYIREEEKLGTAGALGLLPEAPTAPLIVMNADLLTNLNFDRLFEFHREQKSMLTMCVREYDFQVPYGVIELEKNRVIRIDEKPIHKFFVNAGIYVLEPEAVALVPRNGHLDMPALIDMLIRQRKETSAFPITEYWLDIGRRSDFDRANGDYVREFK